MRLHGFGGSARSGYNGRIRRQDIKSFYALPEVPAGSAIRMQRRTIWISTVFSMKIIFPTTATIILRCLPANRPTGSLPPMPAAKTKNLLLRDKKGLRHFLVVVGYDKTVDLKALAADLEVGKLALASPERLKKHLGVDPGSVTILSVVNDPENRVEVILDAPLWNEEALRCHPLVNTSTLVISKKDVERIFQITGHSVTVMDIPARQTILNGE